MKWDLSGRQRPVLAWLVLICATGVSLALGHSRAGAVAAIGIIGVAMAKIGLVVWEFMDVRHAPTLLRALFAAWAVVLGVTMCGVYLLG